MRNFGYFTWTQTSKAYERYRQACLAVAEKFAPLVTASAQTETTTTVAPEIKPWRHPRSGVTRYYINNVSDIIGLNVSRYKTGNISGAWLDNEVIANRQASMILTDTAGVFFTIDDEGGVKLIAGSTQRYLNREITREEVASKVLLAIQEHVNLTELQS